MIPHWYGCMRCDWKGPTGRCANCKSGKDVEPLCDEAGCLNFASVGQSTPQGYRWRCGIHAGPFQIKPR